MRQKLYYSVVNFVGERYGMDEINQCLICAAFASALGLWVFHGSIATGLFSVAGAGALACIYYRMLSKNIAKRKAENDAYLYFRHRQERVRLIEKRSSYMQKKHGYAPDRVCGRHICILVRPEAACGDTGYAGALSKAVNYF